MNLIIRMIKFIILIQNELCILGTYIKELKTRNNQTKNGLNNS